MSRRVPALGWVAALATFLTFLAVSSYFVMNGKSNCGCFGLVETNPVTILGLDILVILMLVLYRPEMNFTGVRQLSIQLASIGLGTAAILLVVSFVAWVRYGSIKTAITAVTGRPFASDLMVDFGEATPGEHLGKTVTISNNSTRAVRLIGGTTDCSCVTTSDLPINIPENSSVEIHIQLSVPHSASGIITHNAYLLTDTEAQRTVRVRLICKVENHG